jgi:hypothetical protein
LILDQVTQEHTCISPKTLVAFLKPNNPNNASDGSISHSQCRTFAKLVEATDAGNKPTVK